jgi:hypothetical protein
VRSVTDPFLWSASDDESAPSRPVSRTGELALRSGLPRAVLDVVPAEVAEDFVTRVERWADLSAGLHQALQAAGFRQHDPWGAGGGFHIAAHVHDDGVLVSWATRQYTSHEPGSFENTMADIMTPALQAILAACGFAAQTIPDGRDYPGYLLVTGRTGTPAWSADAPGRGRPGASAPPAAGPPIGSSDRPAAQIPGVLARREA